MNGALYICALLLFVNTSAPLADNLHPNLNIPELLARLRHGKERERYDAAIALLPLKLTLPDAIQAFAETAGDTSASVRVRVEAANALRLIGPAAASASEALVDMILDEKLDEGDANTAAYAWAALRVPLSKRLVAAVSTSQSVRVVDTGAVALMATGSPDAAMPLIAALAPVDEASDPRVERITEALKNLSPAAASFMTKSLTSATKIQKVAIARALSEMQSRSGGSADQGVLEALLRLLDDPDSSVTSVAAEALGNFRAEDPRVADKLIRLIHSDADGFAKSAAAYSLVRVARSDARVGPALVEVLLSVGDSALAKVIDAVRNAKDPPVDLLCSKLSTTRDPALRARIIRGLGAVGPSAGAATTMILPDLSGSDDQFSAAIQSLPKLGPHALQAVPLLVAQLATERDAERRHQFIEALAELAPMALAPLPKDVSVSSGALRAHLANAEDLVENEAKAADDPDEFRRDYLQPIALTVRQLKADALARYSLVGAIMMTCVVGAGIAGAGSWRLQRRLRIMLGQRWVFAIGVCDYSVEITDGLDGARLAVRPLKQDARSNVFSLFLPRRELPGAETRQIIQAQLPPPSLIRVEIDRSLFAMPWAFAVGDAWSGAARNSRIAGQLCLTSTVSPIHRDPRQKRLAFAGLRCARDRVNPVLPSVISEIAEVTALAHRWGADVIAPESDVGLAEMLAALEEADIVHAAIHANAEGLSLRDGLLRAEHLVASRRLRCRLLVLSACEAADLSLPGAFLWAALNNGMNVLAATKPVDDAVCRIFFNGFYAAMLPRRNVGGITIAAAISAGTIVCASRFAAAAERIGNQEWAGKWKETVDSFVLFGDPSLSLQLRGRV